MDGSLPAELMTKGDFAVFINVSPGRVSQYIADGKIGSDALEGEGRSAKIRVRRAMEQLKLRLDVGQRLGNGIKTRLTAGAVSPPIEPSYQPTSFEAQIQREKLESLQRANRKGAEEEAARAGLFTETAAVRQQMTRLVADTLGVFEGSLPDIATAISAKFEVPQRDVLHLLRGVMRGIRQKAADQARRRSSDMPALVEYEAGDVEEDEAA